MSKSKGNVVTPDHLLDQYSSDAIRYWSARARLGADTAFDESVLGIGKKLVTKLFNASKFVWMQIEDAPELSHDAITQPMDQSFLAALNACANDCRSSFESLDYASALDMAETLFWQFCDDYIELVKGRVYREEDLSKKASGQATLRLALDTFLKVFAPFIPFITEEVWSWTVGQEKKSIHTQSWPSLPSSTGSRDAFDLAREVMVIVRGEKTRAQVSMKHPVDRVTIHANADQVKTIQTIQDDIKRAGVVETIDYVNSDEAMSVSVQLAAVNQTPSVTHQTSN